MAKPCPGGPQRRGGAAVCWNTIPIDRAEIEGKLRADDIWIASEVSSDRDASHSPSCAADISQTAADALFQGAYSAPVIEIQAVAKAAHRMASQNFALAIAYNVVFVPLAMIGLAGSTEASTTETARKRPIPQRADRSTPSRARAWLCRTPP